MLHHVSSVALTNHTTEPTTSNKHGRSSSADRPTDTASNNDVDAVVNIECECGGYIYIIVCAGRSTDCCYCTAFAAARCIMIIILCALHTRMHTHEPFASGRVCAMCAFVRVGANVSLVRTHTHKQRPPQCQRPVRRPVGHSVLASQLQVSPPIPTSPEPLAGWRLAHAIPTRIVGPISPVRFGCPSHSDVNCSLHVGAWRCICYVLSLNLCEWWLRV